MKNFLFTFFLFFLFFFGCLNLNFFNEKNKQNEESINQLENQNLKFNNLTKIDNATNTSNTSDISNTSNNSINSNFNILEKNDSVLNCKESQNPFNCYLLLAIKNDDPTFCYYLDYGKEFFSCISNWCSNTSKLNLQDCEKYADAHKRLICINNCINSQ
jgi:preprotein translocase subunit SecG